MGVLAATNALRLPMMTKAIPVIILDAMNPPNPKIKGIIGMKPTMTKAVSVQSAIENGVFFENTEFIIEVSLFAAR